MVKGFFFLFETAKNVPTFCWKERKNKISIFFVLAETLMCYNSKQIKMQNVAFCQKVFFILAYAYGNIT